MNVECPFCGIPIQYYKPDLPNDFKCPGCSKQFTLETIARKKQEAEALLKRKLYELYISSQRPCSSVTAVFRAILLIALAEDKTHFRYEWETAGCPTTLEEINDIISHIDYDPSITVIFSSSNKNKRRSAAGLLYLLSENHNEHFVGHISQSLQNDIIAMVVNQLNEERDMMVVEPLCYVLSHWHEHLAGQNIAVKTILAIANNHGEAVFSASGSSFIEFMNKVIPEARKQFGFFKKFNSKLEAVESMRLMIAEKLKNA